MIWLTTGPELRDRIQSRLGCRVMYTYADADGNRLPEYAATHIKIRAFETVMSPDRLAPLAEALSDWRHCISTECIGHHKILRPQVIAMFERVSS
jgi:hypothetical protein